MKILYVNTTFGGGGAEKVARQLYYGIKDSDTKTYFIAGRYQKGVPGDVGIIYENFSERAASAIIGIANHNFLFRTVLARGEIVDFIKKEKIDIVHFHNIHGNYIAPADIKAIKRHCQNIAITMHDMWLVTGCCCHGMSCNKWRGSGECKKCAGNEELKNGAVRAGWYLKSKSRNLSGNGICFVSPSRWLADCCADSYLASEKIKLIPNGIDIKRFCAFDKNEMRKKHQLPLDKRIILFSANQINSPHKGIGYLIDALTSIPEKGKYFLLIVGNGKADGLKSSFATYSAGYVKDERLMNELYSAADIFVLPSMADTFPLSMLEAMASGTPVLAFKTGGIPEAVNDDVGWCVDAGDSAALAGMIGHIFENKGEYMQKASQCRRYVAENFSEELMLERYRELYRSYRAADTVKPQLDLEG